MRDSWTVHLNDPDRLDGPGWSVRRLDGLGWRVRRVARHRLETRLDPALPIS